jgi:hypothetical protein
MTRISIEAWLTVKRLGEDPMYSLPYVVVPVPPEMFECPGYPRNLTVYI